MKIHNECSFISEQGIKKIEHLRNATYVFESCLKLKDGGWGNWPAAIFYNEQAHPQGSNYFAIYHDLDPLENRLMITDGISATEPFSALQIGEDIIYSRFRHDFRQLNEDTVGFIDGGRDYVRYNPEAGTLVTLKVNKDKLELVDEIQTLS